MAYKQKQANWLLTSFSFKTLLSFLIAMFFYTTLKAQKEDKVWIGGSGFVYSTIFENEKVINTKYVDSTPSWYIYYAAGHSNICDSAGNYLFGCDGMNIYDKTHHFMEGGKKLAPPYTYIKDNGFGGLSQMSIVLPVGNAIYYVFTPLFSDDRRKKIENAINDEETFFDLLWYNIVDMKENEGMGKVVQSKIPIIENGYMSKPEMMAVRHANGRDWWLLKGRYHSIAYHTFLVSAKGVEDYGIQSFPRIGQDYDWDLDGQCVFSRDGSQFATVTGHRGTINLFDFDRCTGKLSNQKAIHVPKKPAGDPADSTATEFMTTVGIAFSPNQQFLYVNGKFNVFQYELANTDSASAWYHVANMDTTFDWFMGYSNMYLGPNDRLYIGNWDGIGSTMSAINEPNKKGVACNWCPKCLRFQDPGATRPPCMPNYRLGVLKGSECDSLSPVPPKVGLFEVYPNPSSTIFYVNYVSATQEAVSFQLYNSIGQIVYSLPIDKTKNIFELDVHHLAKGIYTLKVGKQVKKLVVE